METDEGCGRKSTLGRAARSKNPFAVMESCAKVPAVFQSILLLYNRTRDDKGAFY